MLSPALQLPEQLIRISSHLKSRFTSLFSLTKTYFMAYSVGTIVVLLATLVSILTDIGERAGSFTETVSGINLTCNILKDLQPIRTLHFCTRKLPGWRFAGSTSSLLASPLWGYSFLRDAVNVLLVVILCHLIVLEKLLVTSKLLVSCLSSVPHVQEEGLKKIGNADECNLEE